MNPYLAIFRSGPGSLHATITGAGTMTGFDYALSWFGADEPAEDLGRNAVFVHTVAGAKWPGLAATLKEHWDTIARYEYVWLPDDDLLCTPQTVIDLFTACDQLRLDLAQPALTRDSYVAHPITLQHTAFQVRFTNFVEIMAPVVSRDMLARILPTMEAAVSGWGLDSVWPRMSTLGGVGIVDAAPVRHTRPVGGPNYAHSRDKGLPPREEAMRAYARFGVDQRTDLHLNLGGLTADGDGICLGGGAQTLEDFLGLLNASLAQSGISFTQLVRYLGRHADFVERGGQGTRFDQPFARAFVRAELNDRFAALGLTFAG